MTDISRPRCECCDEVLEELLTMRQNFEKLCQRLGNQIVELRREMRSMVAATATATSNRNHNTKEEHTKSSKHNRKSRSCSTERSAPRKRTRSQRVEESSDLDEAAGGGGLIDSVGKTKIPRAEHIKQEATAATSPAANASIATAVAKSQARARRPVLEFFGIQARVLPTRPFAKSAEFEDWETLLQSDADQRDQLRVELLQGNTNSPDKFIKQTWRSILSDEATMHYTYHGNAKTVKKPVKNYTFTAIFQEVFVQLFERMDSSYFMERTMRFFNYCHDRTRRLSRLNQTREIENLETTIQFETTNVDDQTEAQITDNEDDTYAEIFAE